MPEFSLTCEPGHHRWRELHRSRGYLGRPQSDGGWVFRCERCGKREIDP